MKSVLLSIQPKWCDLIASGKKTVEVRKTRPKIETPFKCYIYCTKASKAHQTICGCMVLNDDELYRHPTEGIKYGDSIELMLCYKYSQDNFLNGKVIGEFVCDKIDWHGNSVYVIREECIKALEGSCLTEEEFHNYMNYPPINPYQDLREAIKKYEFYGWHISNLVIYDKPKELSELKQHNRKCYFDDLGYAIPKCKECKMCNLKRPPQSWCYVKE